MCDCFLLLINFVCVGEIISRLAISQGLTISLKGPRLVSLLCSAQPLGLGDGMPPLWGSVPSSGEQASSSWGFFQLFPSSFPTSLIP